MKNNLNDKAIKILNELLEELKNIPTDKKLKYSSVLNYVINYIQSNEMSLETESVLNDNKCGDKPYFDKPAVVGDEVTLIGKKYIVANIDKGIVYLILKYWDRNCYFLASSNVDSTYTFKNECICWYNKYVPKELKDRGSIVNQECNGESMPCFIPSREMVQHWNYFNTIDRRIFEDINGDTHNWWTSSAYSADDAWRVNTVGELRLYHPSAAFGFRPALAIKKSEFGG